MPARPADEVRVIAWNLFHARDPDAAPTAWRALRARARTAAGGRVHVPRKLTAPMALVLRAHAPDLVLLQEVPPAELAALARGAGMIAGWSVRTGPRVGPPAARARLGSARPDLWRTHEGNVNALLVGPRLRAVPGSGRVVRLSPARRTLRDLVGRRLEPGEALRWAMEARAAVLARVEAPGGASLTVASVHLHNARHPWQAEREVQALVEALGAVEGPLVVGGDMNVPPGHAALAPLASLGLADPGARGPGIDRILVRGVGFAAPPRRWAVAERTVERRGPGVSGPVLLSDHDPVEAVLRLPPTGSGSGAARPADR